MTLYVVKNTLILNKLYFQCVQEQRYKIGFNYLQAFKVILSYNKTTCETYVVEQFMYEAMD